MPTFENQVDALIRSAQSICSTAESCKWNGQGWSPIIILGHVLDVDNEVWMPRFEMMKEAINNKRAIPQLSWWEPDAAITENRYAHTSLETAKTNLLASRDAMKNFLLGISIQERSASANHRVFGEVSIEAMLQVILDHDQEHRASLD